MGLMARLSVVFCIIALLSQSAFAAGSNTRFSKSAGRGNVVFDISSRQVSGTAVQIVTVTARRSNKKIATRKADSDFVPQSAQAVSLSGSADPELVLIGTASVPPKTESADVYWIDGSSLRRASLPDPADRSGYRGGDRIKVEGRLIVRTVPVYRDGDPDGRPGGGSRILKYEFRNGAFLLTAGIEKAAEPPAAVPAERPVIEEKPVKPEAPVQVEAPAEQPVRKPAVETSPFLSEAPRTPADRPEPDTAAAVAPSPAEPAAPAATIFVNSITAGDGGIEIAVSGFKGTHKVVRLENPERLAIDIPEADSPLAGRKVELNRFGISTAKVGRNDGSMRITFSASLNQFPKYDVKTVSTGLLVVFPQ